MYLSKQEGDLGLGNLVLKNVTLVGKWLWRFPLESQLHKVMDSTFGIQMNWWDVNLGTYSFPKILFVLGLIGDMRLRNGHHNRF